MNHRYQLARQFDREAAAEVAATREQERQRIKAAIEQNKAVRIERDRRLLAAWDALKVGDQFTPGNNAITIKRKNAWSVTDTNGINWSITEVIGLSRKDVVALREAM